MKDRRLLFFIFTIVFLLVVALFWRGGKKQSRLGKISSFEDCAKAGYPVMESYPRQCQTPDGRNFVESFVPER